MKLYQNISCNKHNKNTYTDKRTIIYKPPLSNRPISIYNPIIKPSYTNTDLIQIQTFYTYSRSVHKAIKYIQTSGIAKWKAKREVREKTDKLIYMFQGNPAYFSTQLCCLADRALFFRGLLIYKAPPSQSRSFTEPYHHIVVSTQSRL